MIRPDDISLMTPVEARPSASASRFPIVRAEKLSSLGVSSRVEDTTKTLALVAPEAERGLPGRSTTPLGEASERYEGARTSRRAAAWKAALWAAKALRCPTSRGILLLAAGLALALVSCSKTENPSVLARVGNRAITVADFQREVERLRTANRPVPDKEKLLQEMVDHEALVQRAHQAGVDKDPGLQREIENLLVDKLLDRELEPRLNALEISSNAVWAEYQANLTKYTKPAQVRLALLFLQANRLMSDAKRAAVTSRLEEARAKALAHPAPGGRGPAANGFGALAVNYSDDQASRYRGGDIGWFESGDFSSRWPRAVLKAAYALKKGQISDVIHDRDGFYLVMKTDARPASVTPFQRVEASLRQRLLVEKRSALAAAYRREAATSLGATIHHEALAALKLPPPSTAIAGKSETGPPALPNAGPARND